MINSNTYPIKESVCAICGKKFIPAPYHIYKNTVGGKVRKYCSWTCYCKRETTPRIYRKRGDPPAGGNNGAH